jgi:DNA-directed RNA polymerase II subunit RPB1
MNNKRISKKVNGRTLPHFFQNDDTPHARGFVTSSYVKGLRPPEFFFHTAAGRDGLIDTAIKTADTGYIQRKLIKGMEDVMIYYDGLVRSANNQILQYFYGGSNLDQVKQSPVKINLVNMNQYNEIATTEIDGTSIGSTVKDGEEDKSPTKFYGYRSTSPDEGLINTPQD